MLLQECERPKGQLKRRKTSRRTRYVADQRFALGVPRGIDQRVLTGKLPPARSFRKPVNLCLPCVSHRSATADRIPEEYS
jgi:hypothetical protein